MTDAQTNPVGFLQEICQKYILRFPQYEEINSVGPDHCRKFTFKCSFEGYETCGLSRQKKQAKSESAKAMIDLLEEKDYFNIINPKISLRNDNFNQSTDEKVGSEVSCTDIVSKNPISALNEYCQKQALPPPKFVETSIENTFLCECKLGDNKAYGNGTNKKTAKLEAALKLCVELGIKCNGLESVSSSEEEFQGGKNPVSVLQELCQQKSIKNVEYTTMPSVMNSFVVKCTADSISCEGMGSSKKLAKYHAASKVLGKLGTQNLYANGHINTEDNNPKLPTVLNSNGASAVSPIRVLEDFKIDSSDEENDTDDEKKVSEDNNVNVDVKIEALCLEDTTNKLKNESDSKEQEAQEGPVESC